MQPRSNSIILIGFKCVGKSTLGRELALRLNLPFIDLDREIELIFANEHQEKYSCRQIMETHGQSYFRDLEKKVLTIAIQTRPAVISIGGGTPIEEENQKLIKGHFVIHITAPRDVVFERIMAQGQPAFFSGTEPAFEIFNRLWNEREKIYQKLKNCSIDNSGLITSGINQILQQLASN